MARTPVRPWVFVAAAWLLPAAPAAAQGSALAFHEDLLRDVGTWDAEITQWDPGGKPRTSRAVEINVLGCNGTCLVTTVKKGTIPGGMAPLAPHRPLGTASSREIPQPVQGVGSGVIDRSVLQNEIAPGDMVHPILEPRAPTPGTPIVAGVPPPHRSVEYPDASRRIVTLYGRDKQGNDIRFARIVYTRKAAASQTPTSATTPVRREDVGTWDAVITWWDRGQPQTATGVEINRLGCDRTCLVSTVQGGLLPPPVRPLATPVSMTSAEGRNLPSPQAGVGNTPYSHGSIGWEEFQSAPAGFVRPLEGSMSPERRARALAAPIRAERISVDYPDDDHRIVTMYARGADGTDVPAARIVYTRRK